MRFKFIPKIREPNLRKTLKNLELTLASRFLRIDSTLSISITFVFFAGGGVGSSLAAASTDGFTIGGGAFVCRRGTSIGAEKKN